MRCAANERCLALDSPRAAVEPDEQYDRYGIYAGKWHDPCWQKFGYGNFVFDESYAGEHLEEEDY